MPRLRTTTALSLLLLAGGAAATAWLSGLAGGGPGPVSSSHVASAAHPSSRSPRRPALARAPLKSAPWRKHHGPVAIDKTVVAVAGPRQVMAEPAPDPPTLHPLATPAHTVPFQSMRGHLSGSLVLDLKIDGAGNVAESSVARSSGDPILDQHALASVRGWRFAVPPGNPDGVSGELPMHFAGEVASR